MALQSTTALSTITLQAATSTLTFSSIPSTYRDLILSLETFGTASSEFFSIYFNGDTTNTNYSRVIAYSNSGGNGSVAANNHYISAVYSSNRQLTNVQIFDYSVADKHKSLLTRVAAGQQSEVVMVASRWANTAAISSISIVPVSGVFSAGSTFSIYGRIA